MFGYILTLSPITTFSPICENAPIYTSFPYEAESEIKSGDSIPDLLFFDEL